MSVQPAAACPVCTATVFDDVFSLHDLPVLINAQVDRSAAPDVPRGDIDLVVCRRCGHLYNRSFKPDLLDYDATYENTLHYSPHFQAFATGLAARLVAELDLIGKRVAELGSGPGHFLSMLCDVGVGAAFGWDPSYDADRLGAPTHAGVTVSSAPFPDDGSVEVDLAMSQHVLEHLERPVDALVALRAAIARRPGGSVYTEVPNGALMIDRCALWDLIYEHRSYFVPSSLRAASGLAGLSTADIGEAFGGQFLWSISRPGEITSELDIDADQVDAVVDAAHRFGALARQRVDAARRQLARWSEQGPVALWGAGSKGATYLNLVSDVAPVAAVVDINPRKTGWGVPGTALTIGLPKSLVDVAPATVVAANPIYVDEIGAELADLGVKARVVPLWD